MPCINHLSNNQKYVIKFNEEKDMAIFILFVSDLKYKIEKATTDSAQIKYKIDYLTMKQSKY